ncbi:hypothetical protein CSB87_0039 [Acinetobacter sp. AR_0276]|nr:hypothetical protein CSB87_0039 [Acinetobacter sp. AR_0276]
MSIYSLINWFKNKDAAHPYSMIYIETACQNASKPDLR